MSPNNSQGLRRKNPNYENHVLDLLTRARMYVRSRLYDKNRKICNHTPFFRPDRVLPANGSTEKTGEPILTKLAT
jgi:hypothetical protein